MLFAGYSIQGLNELSGFEDNGHGSFDINHGYIWWTMQRDDEWLIGDLVAATEGDVLDHNGELIRVSVPCTMRRIQLDQTHFRLCT